MGPPLARRLPPPGAGADDILTAFVDHVAEQGLELYPAQEEALLEIMAGKNVILGTPTGSGKSLVATGAHFKAMAEGKRSFYTCPIKALVNEKFFALCRDFGPESVGMMTGDASVNRDAPIICCTAEILSNLALREGENAPADVVIMDEFHYYADRDRGVAWQIPLLSLPRATFLLMSATLGPTEFFERALTSLTGKPTSVVTSNVRPVPLDFEYRETPLHETVADLVTRSLAPIYIVSFTQRGCAEEAQNLMSHDWATREEKRAIYAELDGVEFSSPYGKEIQKFLRHGIGLHHAGLLPRYRLLCEKLAQRGHMKIICGTDTLGVGVNIPIRTVLFTKLCKYDGDKTAILSVRDFLQISGRAGRKGFDDRGSVVVQAPEHVIENLRMEHKAANDPGKRRKMVKRKPPERGYVHWDRATFERLTHTLPEPLVSRFDVTHGMLLNVLGRPAGGCAAMKQLLRGAHEAPGAKKRLKAKALQLFRSLVVAGIVELVPRAEREPGRGPLRINADLQEDFSLNQALSLWLYGTIERLDPDDPAYALDVLTLVESILENPELVLMRQLDKLKTRTVAELKAKGVEYEQRMEELDKLEYPKPRREFVYETFNAFAAQHPWVGQENIRPKSVAREMFETFQSFAEYVREYDLERAEGLLLRYLSDVYKALVQTVPDPFKTEEVDDIVAYFGTLVRGVDASLLDEWERMRDPSWIVRTVEGRAEPTAPEAPDITRDVRRFTVLVRNALFLLLRALASRDYVAASAMLAPGEEPWTAERLEASLAPFWAEHAAIRLDPAARSPSGTMVNRDREGAWEVQQVVVDAEDDRDWFLDCVIDLDRSREANRPVITLRRLGT